MNMNSSNRYSRRVHLRLALFVLVSSLWVGALVARLVYLQTVARPDLQDRAELQQQHTMKLDASRGTIFDRNERELAVSIDVESVYAVPASIEDKEEAAKQLAACLECDVAELTERLQSEKRFLWVKRKVDSSKIDCIRSLGLSGVSYLPENRRFYPKRAVASHVLGYVGMDNEGMSGVEYALEDDIRGEPGRQIIWTDARRRRAASRVEKRPLAGRDVYLTIDETLQHIAETSLERAVRESGAQKAMAILMRPETGEILAMAAVPFFNPNRYQDYPAGHWRNRAVTDVYEPGSTFKVITAAAAVEEGVVSEEERIDCGQGSIQVGGQVIHDHKVFDVLTFREVLQLSSNVGMIRISQRLGKERLEQYIHAFGFGESTKVNLPAESRGILRPAAGWGARTLASIAFGQEIGVTPLQMVTAVNAIAASGYLMRPQLVREIRAPDGEVFSEFEPEPVRRVVSRETAARLTEILAGVVAAGTGTRAAVAGYTVAGKTGTAQKATPSGGYSTTDYIASFVGFVPAYRPEITALILLDSPTGDHTGARAASVFAEIVEPSLHYLGVPPELDGGVTSMMARWPRQKPLASAPLTGHRMWSPVTPAVAGRSVPGGIRVPALYGLPARDAVVRAIGMRLAPKLVGSGWVIGQEPPAGRLVGPGTRFTLILGPPGATGFGDAVRIADDTRRGGQDPGTQWVHKAPARSEASF